MGQSHSKGNSGPGDSLQSYPSFSRSDTKESLRSIRGSIRSKIRSSDSPRASTSALSTGSQTDRSDAGSIKSTGSRRSSTNLSAQSPGANDSASQLDAPDPPPSPTLSSSLKRGHKDVDAMQQSGEVDHVSDAPPTGAAPTGSSQKVGESILIKRQDQLNPILDFIMNTPLNDTSSSPGMGMGALKSIDLDDMITRLLDAGYSTKVTKTVCLKNAEITAICTAARELFLSQPALLELSAPVKIVGDVHGQYTDLIRLFEMCGFPPSSNYLFLGDYVDRGKQSLETILLLLCYKLKYPENFFLLRGNHECANVTRVYGFYDECKRRCNIKIWKTFIDTFNCLPIASIVAGKIFCVHGGLSPSLSHMDDIRGIARPTDVPDYGLLNDLLWSDPADMEEDWEPNERGVSYCFGKKVIMNFLQRHDFDLVCRAHMVVEDGYEFYQDRILVTVFSAPNVSNFLAAPIALRKLGVNQWHLLTAFLQYCGEFDNWGAIMSVSDELLCSFELLKPLDSTALKNHIKKGRNKRNSMLNSPVSSPLLGSLFAKEIHFCAVQQRRELCVLKLPLFGCIFGSLANCRSLQLYRPRVIRRPGDSLPRSRHPPCHHRSDLGLGSFDVKLTVSVTA